MLINSLVKNCVNDIRLSNKIILFIYGLCIKFPVLQKWNDIEMQIVPQNLKKKKKLLSKEENIWEGHLKP